MKLLTLDPSSSRSGYAVTTGPTPAEILHAGYFTPRPQRLPAYERIAQMVIDLEELLAEEEPAAVLIEMPDGKIHGRNRKSGGAGQSIYGAAAGALWQVVRSHSAGGAGGAGGPSLETIDPNTWTRSRTKAQRHAELARLCPSYAEIARSDSGGDVGDAIGLAWWWWGCNRT